MLEKCIIGRYRLYIDESGDHVFHSEETMKQDSHRYLNLLGCIFKMDVYLDFHRKIEDFKQRHFPHNPDEPVILHRSEIMALVVVSATPYVVPVPRTGR